MTSFNDVLSDASYKFLQSHYKDGVMDLRNCKLTSVPMELLKFKDMKELYLDNNQLTSIPKEIGQLINLKKLNLGFNQLTSIPPEIGQLINLKELWLYNNELTSIPPEIGQLVNLRYLSLSYNQLTSIPPEIGQLVNLQELYLSHNNQLTSIPPELGQLVNIQRLYLSGNKLTSIPSELGQLVNLTIYGYDKPKPVSATSSFKEKLKSLTQKALEERQKEVEDYPSKWMTLYKEKFEENMDQEAKNGKYCTTYYFNDQLITSEKCNVLEKHLREVYKDFNNINVGYSYVTIDWK